MNNNFQRRDTISGLQAIPTQADRWMWVIHIQMRDTISGLQAIPTQAWQVNVSDTHSDERHYIRFTSDTNTGWQVNVSDTHSDERHYIRFTSDTKTGWQVNVSDTHSDESTVRKLLQDFDIYDKWEKIIYATFQDYVVTGHAGFTKLHMGLVSKMSVLINFLMQNTNLVSVLKAKSVKILLVMSDRTDKLCKLWAWFGCLHPYVIGFELNY
jgi:hypothetical protein